MSTTYRTFEVKNRTLKGMGEGVSEFMGAKNRRTSFMDIPLWQQTTAKNLRTRKSYNIWILHELNVYTSNSWSNLHICIFDWNSYRNVWTILMLSKYERPLFAVKSYVQSSHKVDEKEDASDQFPIWIFNFRPYGQLRAIRGKNQSRFMCNFLFSWAKIFFFLILANILAYAQKRCIIFLEFLFELF